MNNSSDNIIVILEKICNYLNDPNTDTGWSRFKTSADAIDEIQEHIQLLKYRNFTKLKELNELFLPTGALQEISISSSWGEEFLEFAGIFDENFKKLFDP